MALWGVAVMAGPVLGPVLGGWLTEAYSWRYVFYINLPIGILTLFGMMTFLQETPSNATAKLDWFGFGMLSLTIGAGQVLLDRGEELDWFSSREIIVEAIIAGSAFYLFLVHTFTAGETVRPARPFPRPELYRRGSVRRHRRPDLLRLAGLAAALSSGAHELPDRDRRLVMGPRGVGTMGAMLLVGRMIGKVDTRLLLAFGLGLTAGSFYVMTGWTPDVSQTTIITVGVVQGIGLGFLFVPLSTATLATLSAHTRAEGAGIYSLSRNIGSSVGISVVNSLLTQNTQINHASIVPHVSAVNRGFEGTMISAFWNPLTRVDARRSMPSSRGRPKSLPISTTTSC